jgi:plasmid stabilization system protein ParE
MSYRPPPRGSKLLSVTIPAQQDIDDALAYLARKSGIDIAMQFADHLDAELMKFASLGHAGVARDEISPGLRLTVIGSFSVYFRVTASETQIE